MNEGKVDDPTRNVQMTFNVNGEPAPNGRSAQVTRYRP